LRIGGLQPCVVFKPKFTTRVAEVGFDISPMDPAAFTRVVGDQFTF